VSDRLSANRSLALPPFLSPCCILITSYSMSSPNQIVLADHKAVLLNHEDDYRRSKGPDKQAVVDEIVNEITAGWKGKFKKTAVKGLEQVSQISH